MNRALKIEWINSDLDSVINSNQYFIMKLGIKCAHVDSPTKLWIEIDIDGCKNKILEFI